MSLQFVADILGISYSTARRGLIALNMNPPRVGNTYVLIERQATELAEYLAARQEVRELARGRW